MVALSWCALAQQLIATAAAFSLSSVARDNHAQQTNSSLPVYIVETDSSHYTGILENILRDQGSTVRHKFDSVVFHGISVQLQMNMTETEDVVAEIESMPGIRGMWPAQVSNQTVNDVGEEKPVQVAENTTAPLLDSDSSQRRGIKGFAANTGVPSPWNHVMTQVDKLHKEGFTGKGIKIAVVDTGVNYTHPALGGCFGPGCRVAFGDNFAKSGKKGDPMDCHGHGTEVAGITAGYSSAGKFVGAAPNATLMAYRVLDCNARGTEDDMMAGWLKAYEDGAQVIVSSSGFQGENWAQRPLAMVASRIVAAGVPCIAPLGNQRAQGLFHAMNPSTGQGVMSVNSISQNHAVPWISGYGPTWTLDIKPNILAPGDNVPVTMKHGGYGPDSGTSYSGPLVAGIVALVAEARGSFDPALINSALMSTAEPQRDQRGLLTVAQQGGGLVRAWKAAHTTTVLEPASLAFNDTDFRVRTISLKITNKAKSNVAYRLSNLAATTMYTFQNGALGSPEEKPVQASAGIKTSKSSFSLRPNQSVTVKVMAVEPPGLDSSRLPMWSGWVLVRGSDGTNLSVPYLGLSGSLRSSTIRAKNTLTVRSGSHSNVDIIDRNTSFCFPNPASGEKPGVPASVVRPSELYSPQIFMNVNLALGSPQVRMDIVPLDICPPGNDTSTALDLRSSTSPILSRNCIPDSMVTETDGVKSIGQVAGFPSYYASRNQEMKVQWDGAIPSGGYAPPGRYKFVVRVLAIAGNAHDASHWQTIESPVFFIFYPYNYIYPSQNGKPPKSSTPGS